MPNEVAIRVSYFRREISLFTSVYGIQIVHEALKIQVNQHITHNDKTFDISSTPHAALVF